MNINVDRPFHYSPLSLPADSRGERTIQAHFGASSHDAKSAQMTSFSPERA